MTRVQTHPLISLRDGATVQEAAQLMADCSIGAVGILDRHRRFVGIVTERDLSWFVAQARDATTTNVGEIVNDFPVIVDGPIDDAYALERMASARVRHLLVRESDDLRIVSMRDYMSARDAGMHRLLVKS
jgi:signal-transduction protein with cAMP-binding, CBS, and nucleotidyltransferase domain